MSANTMMIVFGGLLALATVILKTLDVTLIRAPMIGRGRRPRTDIGRGSAGHFGAAHGQPGAREGARSGHTGGAHVPIEFYISDHLAVDQISEDVRVLIDSREAGRLSVDKDHTISVLPVTVSEPGQHQYTLEVTTLMGKGRGEKMQRVGQGTFVAAQGKTFRLTGDRMGDSWSVRMEEEEEEIEE